MVRSFLFCLILILSFPLAGISQEASLYFPLAQGNIWIYHHTHRVEEGIAIKAAVLEETVITEDTVMVVVNGTFSALGNTYANLELDDEHWAYYRTEGNYLYRLNQNSQTGEYYESMEYDFTPSEDDPYNMWPEGNYSPRTIETMSLPYEELTGYLCVTGYGPDGLHHGRSMFFVKTIGPAYLYYFNGWAIPPEWDYYSLISLNIERSPDAVAENDIPSALTLFPAIPNPFNPATTISYDLPRAEQVTVTIYNIQGQLVDILVDEHQSSGIHRIVWKAGRFSSGLYFYRVETRNKRLTGKMMLLK